MDDIYAARAHSCSERRAVRPGRAVLLKRLVVSGGGAHDVREGRERVSRRVGRPGKHRQHRRRVAAEPPPRVGSVGMTRVQ